MNNKRVRQILISAFDPKDYPNHEVKNGYTIQYEDFTKSKKIEIPYKVDEYGYVNFLGLKDKEVLLKFKDIKNRDKQLMYFKDNIVELQEKFCCSKCNNGWLNEVSMVDSWNDTITELGYTCVNCETSFLPDLTKSILNFYPPELTDELIDEILK